MAIKLEHPQKEPAKKPEKGTLEAILQHTLPLSQEEMEEFVKSIYESRGKDVSKFKNGMLPQD